MLSSQQVEVCDLFEYAIPVDPGIVNRTFVIRSSHAVSQGPVSELRLLQSSVVIIRSSFRGKISVIPFP